MRSVYFKWRGVLVTAFASVLMGQVFAHGTTPHGAHSNQHPPRERAAAPEQKPWGIEGEAKAVRRTIVIRMTDNMRFVPDRIDIKRGETVRLVAENAGKVLHELVIGTAQELEEHAALMKKFPNMEHDEPWMTHVDPGKSGEILWNFNRAGNFQFACLLPGHFEAGMRGQIRVTP